MPPDRAEGQPRDGACANARRGSQPGRTSPRRRTNGWLLRPDIPLAVMVVIVASLGYGGGLAMQGRLVELTPEAVRDQALAAPARAA